MSILGIATSLLSGGLTGVIGGVAGKFFDFLNKKQDIKLKAMDLDHDVKLKELDIQSMTAEWSARTHVAELEGEAKVAVADAETLKASVWKEPDRYGQATPGFNNDLMVVLDFIRGIIRPGITIALMLFTYSMYVEARAIMTIAGPLLNADQAFDVYSIIVNTVLYLTSTTVGWWFASRPGGLTRLPWKKSS